MQTVEIHSSQNTFKPLAAFAPALVAILFFCTVFSSAAMAGNSGITYHGRIVKPDGSGLEGRTVQFQMQLRSPGPESCLLYQEVQTINMAGTNGVFTITLNDGTGTRNDNSGILFNTIFSNRSSFAFPAGSCAGGTAYNPNLSDGRAFVVAFRDESMASFETLPAQAVNFSPMAIQALQIAGFSPANLLRFDDATAALNTSPLNTVQYNALMAVANGTAPYVKSTASGGAVLPVVAGSPGTPASGSIWFNSSTGAVQYYNGTTTQTLGASGGAGTVTSVATGTGLSGGPITNSGTISLATFGTAGTYYKVITDATGRVSSGSAALIESDIPTLVTAGKVSGAAITSGTIGGTTAINTTGNIAATNISGTSLSGQSLLLYNTGNTHKVTVSVPPTLATDYSLVFPLTAGSSGYVLSTDGSGNLSWVSSGAGSVTSVTAGTGLSGGTISTSGTIALASTTVVAGTYGSATQVPQYTVNAQGQLTAASNVTITGVVPGGSAGGDLSGTYPNPTVAAIQGKAVNTVAPTDGQMLVYNNSTSKYNAVSLSGDATMTNAGALTLPTSGVSAGTYGSATQVSQITVDAKGRVTAASNVTITGAAPTGSAGGDLSGTFPNPTVAKLNGTGLSTSALATGNYLRYNGTNWVNAAIPAGDLPTLATGYTGVLPVANGGTGTSTGSITGTGALTFAAGGTNQNVRLTPSGTGSTILSGNVGVGSTSPGAALDVVQTAFDTATRGINLTGNGNDTMLSLGNTSAGGLTWWLDSTGAGAGAGAGKLVIGNGASWAGSNLTLTPNHTGFGYSTLGTANVSMSGSLAVGGVDGVDSVTVYGGASASNSRYLNTATGSTSGDGTSFGIDSTGRANIWNYETQPILFATAGVERLRIDATGNVGIGTTSPVASMDLSAKTDAIALPKGASMASGAIAGMLRYNTGSSGVEFYNGAIWTTLAASGGSYLSSSGGTLSGALTISSGGESLTGGLNNNAGGITSAGSITGVGANVTGTGALTVAAGGTAQNLSLNASTTASVNVGNGDGTSLSVLDGGASTVDYVTVKGSATGGSPTIGTAGSDANINLTLTPKGTGNTIVSSGNVGIGTTSAPQALTVAGNINLSGTLTSGVGSTATGANGVALGSNNSAGGANSFALGYSNNASNSQAIALGRASLASGYTSAAIGNTVAAPSYEQVAVGAFNVVSGTETAGSWVATDPIFSVGNGQSGTNSTALQILKNGNVGIGTTAPAIALSLGSEAGRTIGLERTQLGTTGYDLTIQASGAKSGVTNGDGGNLILNSGLSTGNHTSNITFNTPNFGAGGSSDNALGNQMTINANGVGVGGVNPVSGYSLTSGGAVQAYGDLTLIAAAPKTVNLNYNASNTLALPPANQTVGSYRFGTGDGSVLRTVADISAAVDKTGGAGNMPGRLTFSTSQNGGVVLTERMRIDSLGNVGIGTTSPAVSLDLGTKSDAIALPKGATQPSTPASGWIRYNTTSNLVEFYNGSSWISLSSGGSGTVTSVAAGTGLSGGTITSSGTLSLASTTVVAGTYGSATQVPQYTVNAQGQLTAASNVTITGVVPGGTAGGDLSGTYPNPGVAKLNGTGLSTSALATGNYLRYNGTNWVNAAIPAGDLPTLATGYTGVLPVANGGTGTSNGSITGTSALTFTAGGTNQSVSLIPTGTGSTVLGGNVGIGTTSATTALDLTGALSVRGMSAPALSPAGQGRIYFDSTSNAFQVSQNGGAYTSLVGGGGGGGLPAADGTAAAPTINFTSETSTGFYRSAAGTVRYSSSGSDSLIFGSKLISIPSTGAAEMGAGVVQSNAAYHFNGDAGTGMFRPASSTLALTTGNTERMRIDSSGNVGIGTTSAGAKLEVNGAAIVDTTLTLGASGGTTASLNLWTAANSFYVGNSNGYPMVNGGYFQFAAGGSNPISYYQNPMTFGGNALAKSTVDVAGNLAVGSYANSTAAPTNGLIVSGNVGIGTSSPTAALQVVQTLGATDNQGLNLTSALSDTNFTITNSTAAGNNWFFDSVGTGGGYPAGSLQIGNGVNWDVSVLSLATSGVGVGYANNGIARLAVNGPVGIGTNSPYTSFSNKATVTSDAGGVGENNGAISWIVPGAGYAGTFFNSSTSGSSLGLLVKSAMSGANAVFSVDSGAAQATPGTALLRVLGNGSVGIGTASPTNALEVAGTASVNAINEGVASYATASATTYTIADATLNARRIVLGINTTITLPAFTSTTLKIYTMTVFLKQDATGGRTAAWAGNGSDTVKWDNNAAPTISSVANGVTILQFTKASDETVWYGSMVWKQQ